MAEMLDFGGVKEGGGTSVRQVNFYKSVSSRRKSVL